ncbi:thioesterase superfamily protein [Alteromonadaceae bacterium 2753L.S.0a.02]|nr:thioesterase superfamily protein [Alteromonadaceae bacterium 2753L.S.0a.02]
MESHTPKNDIEVKLLDMFCAHAGAPILSVNDDFFSAGGSRTTACGLIKEIVDVFDTKLGFADLKANPTVSKLAKVIKNDRSILDFKVISLNAQKSKPPIYFICGIALYAPLAKRLSDHFSCYGIYIPEEKEFLDAGGGMAIEALASHYVAVIKQHNPQAPMVLAGVSFGGVLAFEIARQLRETGNNVAGLIILDTVLPGALKKNWQVRKNSLTKKLRHFTSGAWFKSLQTSKSSKPPKKDLNVRLWNIIRGKVTTAYFNANPQFAGDALIIRAEDQAGHDLVPDMMWMPKLSGSVILAKSPGSHLEIIRSKETAEHIINHIQTAPVFLD